MSEKECNWPDCGFDTNQVMSPPRCCKSEPSVPATIVPQWQPIETAPKDGTRILVRDPEYPGAAGISVAWWTDTDPGWHDSDNGVGWWINGTVADWHLEEYLELHPDLWMPLPAAPVAENAAKDDAK